MDADDEGTLGLVDAPQRVTRTLPLTHVDQDVAVLRSAVRSPQHVLAFCVSSVGDHDAAPAVPVLGQHIAQPHCIIEQSCIEDEEGVVGLELSQSRSCGGSIEDVDYAEGSRQLHASLYVCCVSEGTVGMDKEDCRGGAEEGTSSTASACNTGCA